MARYPGMLGKGPIQLTIRGPLADRLRKLAFESNSASPHSWCLEALEMFVVERRSNKDRPDPLRHTALNVDTNLQRFQ